MDSAVEEYGFEDMEVGRTFSFSATISAEDIDRYGEVSGDISPLHMDAAFARDRGFDSRVVHGTLLASYVSRMVGVHFPGRNALLHSIDLKFMKPVYAGDKINISAVVDRASSATRVVVLKVSVENTETGQAHARGKVQVGFTENSG